MSAPLPKKQKREAASIPPEYVKEPGKPGLLNPHWRRSFPRDEEEDSDRGKVVDVPDALRLYGVWRRVPGFWKILASDEGFIMTEGDVCVRTPTVGYNHYLKVWCNGRSEGVHLLVARAFKGRPTAEQMSVDHKDRDESNNCEANLDWATVAQQRRNQGDRKAYSHGEPCLVWEVKGPAGGKQRSAAYMTPVENTMERFPSKTAAAKALGLHHGKLSDVLNENAKTAVGTDGTRYTGKWDPDLADLEGEEWKTYWRSEKLALRISNHGRIQWGYPGRWGHMHYPLSSDAKGYLRVTIDRQHKRINILVGELFYKGSYPDGWKVWDHQDLDKQNNHIDNLRPVTFEENGVNRKGQRDFYIWPKDDPDQWERCVSQSATARAYNLNRGNLSSVLHKRPDNRGSVPKTVGGYCAAWCDEVE